MVLNRRALGLALLATTSLAACASKTTDQLHQDVMLISAGMDALVASLQAVPKIPAGVLAHVTSVIADIRANASQIAVTLTPGVDLVQSVTNGVQTLAALLMPYYDAAPSIAAVIQAAVSLVPVVLASVGVSAATMRGSMSPDAARMVLRTAAAK